MFIFTTKGLNLRSLAVIFEAHYIADVFFYWWNQGMFSFFNSFFFVVFLAISHNENRIIATFVGKKLQLCSNLSVTAF